MDFPSSWSWGAFLLILVGYLSFSLTLQLVFFNNSRRPAPRASNHWYLIALNLLIAAVFALVTTELCLRGRSRMSFDQLAEYGALRAVSELLLACVLENSVEYYWHCMNHLRFFYTRFHKVHHYYKSPRPFDDMYMHPLEAVIYYCILYSPPFILPMHCYAFTGYMIIMGLCGILDHAGIPLAVPGLYNTRDHEAHHRRFDVNFGFPFPFLDLLHGTYEGEFLGKSITRGPRHKGAWHS